MRRNKSETQQAVPEERGDLSAFSLPPYHEIPDVGLFLEQTSKYVSGCLEPQTGLSLTPFMISNYVKQKLIPHPVKKQYGREQIAILFVISLLKTVLSLDEIRLLLDISAIREDTAIVYETVSVFLSDALARVLRGAKPAQAKSTGKTAATELLTDTLLTVAHRLSLYEKFSKCQE